ncbi:MAG: prepilin-type N-terminal cleavage/methylation domain-containing protein [Myxococcota bacterium]|nr:prepilin-type N-terminal cleavage/methylation domain-containing protein [Myxococcota bacterium]
MRRVRDTRGFTLLEMLAVIFLVSVLLFVAIDFYLDLSRASNAAVEQTRSARRAVVLLDRVAHDLEGAELLVRPPDVDPLAFPWLFLAESGDPDAGADRVKFVRRGRDPRGSTGAVSDLEIVAWVAEATEEGDIELRRWSAPELPESLDRTFPDAGQSDLVTAGLASFGIRFQDPQGGWTGRWDSSTLTASNELPLAAEIEVSFVAGPDGEGVEGPYTRQVLLPLRPLDLAAQLAEAAGQPLPDEVVDEDGDGDIDDDDVAIAEERRQESGEAEEEDEECVTVAQCIALNPQLQSVISLGGELAQDVVRGSPNVCASQFAGFLSAFGGLPANCQ